VQNVKAAINHHALIANNISDNYLLCILYRHVQLAADKYALQSCKSRMTPWSNSLHIFRFVVILTQQI